MIVRSRGGRLQVRTTFADLGIPTAGMSADRTAGMVVNSQTAAGIPAVTQAVRLAAQSVASLDLGVYRGRGAEKTRVTATWQARLLAGDPNDQQNTYLFKETIEESVDYRGNAFLWKNKDPASGRVTELFALHPDQVLPLVLRTGERVYYVYVRPGFIDPVGKGLGYYRVGPETILHVRGHGQGGAWLAPSPLELHAQSLGVDLARQNYEAGLFARGTATRIAITLPEGMKHDQVGVWRDMWRASYEGAENAGRTAVLGGGATLQQIGLTQADAQFIESQEFGIEEVARIFNVPTSLLWAGRGRGHSDAPLSPEHEEDRWLRYGLGPRLSRIEAALQADPDLFGSGSATYPMFDTTGVVRGDLMTEAGIEHQQIQDGSLLVDEARARRGLPPLPGGVGSIPQITPVGGGPNQFQGGSQSALADPAPKNPGEYDQAA